MNAKIFPAPWGGRPAGSSWIARCPAHEDREPSLSISDARDGKTLVRCHAGCTQDNVIAVLRTRGLWTVPSSFSKPRSTRGLPGKHIQDQEDRIRTEAAFAIWHSSKLARDLLVETVFVDAGDCGPAPESLRFHPGAPAPFRRCLARDGRACHGWHRQ